MIISGQCRTLFNATQIVGSFGLSIDLSSTPLGWVVITRYGPLYGLVSLYAGPVRIAGM